MTILEYLATPSDLYQMALEVNLEWDAGLKETRANLDKADEMKQDTKPKGKRR